jgi:nucleolar protein 14
LTGQPQFSKISFAIPDICTFLVHDNTTMPESQLKRLKASLRAAGVTGQQKPKKAAKKGQQFGKNASRLDRNMALQSIREEFNPFELKTNREKHSVLGRGRIKGAQGRPGLSKQIGEENVCLSYMRW